MVHRLTPVEVGQKWIVHLARSWYLHLHLHLHPLSWVRISRILSMKGNLYVEATLEVGRHEQCLDAVKTTLSVSEEETNVA